MALTKLSVARLHADDRKALAASPEPRVALVRPRLRHTGDSPVVELLESLESGSTGRKWYGVEKSMKSQGVWSLP